MKKNPNREYMVYEPETRRWFKTSRYNFLRLKRKWRTGKLSEKYRFATAEGEPRPTLPPGKYNVQVAETEVVNGIVMMKARLM